MNILIVSYLFYPGDAIGTVRPSKFAKYLSLAGHNVTVICCNRYNLPNEMINSNITIHYIDHSRLINRVVAYATRKAEMRRTLTVSAPGEVKQNKTFRKKAAELKSRIKGVTGFFYYIYNQYDWSRQCSKVARRKFGKGTFDIIFSSYGPLGSFLAGEKLFDSGIGKCWVSDFRDVNLYRYQWWLEKHYFSELLKRVTRKASAITVVSKGQEKVFRELCNGFSHSKARVEVITNGFDNLNLPVKKVTEREKAILRIGYFGRFYGDDRDMSMLFRAIEMLTEEGKINLGDIELQYAGRDFNIIRQQALKFGLEQILENKGTVSQEESLSLQLQCDLLVVLSWNRRHEEGILTGKFFQYLGTSKPIISITSGDLPGAELSAMVDSMRLGLAFEYAAYEKDLVRLKEYLYECFCEVSAGRKIPHNPEQELVDKYNYRNLTAELEEIFRSVTTGHRAQGAGQGDQGAD